MRNEMISVVLTSLLLATSAHADTSVCPKAEDIKASAFKSPDATIPEPYNEGFKYEAASSTGKKWEGETLASTDSFLEKEYELKPVAMDEQGTKIVCSYGGKSVQRGTTTSKPYLKMTLDK
ncbi:hypothetical protein ACIQAL_24995 [Pseudomonas sp. NPDC088368]|jgi:hypothetical protein|uniref:hypothetical protein n=1 Tax=Pseudomonas sp. NPDC088368 TaxID=3364453 RepID=UPI00380FFC60